MTREPRATSASPRAAGVIVRSTAVDSIGWSRTGQGSFVRSFVLVIVTMLLRSVRRSALSLCRREKSVSSTSTSGGAFRHRSLYKYFLEIQSRYGKPFLIERRKKRALCRDLDGVTTMSMVT